MKKQIVVKVLEKLENNRMRVEIFSQVGDEDFKREVELEMDNPLSYKKGTELTASVNDQPIFYNPYQGSRGGVEHRPPVFNRGCLNGFFRKQTK